MKSETILGRNSPVLRKKALPVDDHEFGSVELLEVIDHMRHALAKCDDGVALAAPQIGIGKRIFIVAGKIFRSAQSETTPDDLAFINPRLVKISSKRAIMDEGCLSVRGVYGKIERAEKATVEARNIDGKKFTRGASGLLAQIFQHEIDHLEGVLFIDKAISLDETKKK